MPLFPFEEECSFFNEPCMSPCSLEEKLDIKVIKNESMAIATTQSLVSYPAICITLKTGNTKGSPLRSGNFVWFVLVTHVTIPAWLCCIFLLFLAVVAN